MIVIRRCWLAGYSPNTACIFLSQVLNFLYCMSTQTATYNIVQAIYLLDTREYRSGALVQLLLWAPSAERRIESTQGTERVRMGFFGQDYYVRHSIVSHYNLRINWQGLSLLVEWLHPSLYQDSYRICLKSELCNQGFLNICKDNFVPLFLTLLCML